MLIIQKLLRFQVLMLIALSNGIVDPLIGQQFLSPFFISFRQSNNKLEDLVKKIIIFVEVFLYYLHLTV